MVISNINWKEMRKYLFRLSCQVMSLILWGYRDFAEKRLNEQKMKNLDTAMLRGCFGPSEDLNFNKF
jgi:hypothetical protein